MSRYNYTIKTTVTAMQIEVSMIDAIKVQFLKPIFSDDFAERGMKAYLTKIEWNDNIGCYKLYFDFSEFEAENMKYFSASYYPNRFTRENCAPKDFYTAIECGMYTPKYEVYFSISGNGRNDAVFESEIPEYLRVID